jgi:aspartyl-tRNA(Asn)/glutamyl-tRNA(Gln) amidotransferase subunit B
MIRRGHAVVRETRHFLEARGITQSARSKEQEQDYRYFPEPDLRPLHVQSWVREIVLPELPDARRERFMAQYGCSLNHARTLTGDLRLANFFERVVHGDPKGLSSLAATWTADTLIGELNYRDMSLDTIDAESFSALLLLLKNSTITDKSGVDVLRVMLDQRFRGEPADTPDAIVDRLGVRKIVAVRHPAHASDSPGNGSDPVMIAISDVLREQPKAVEDYRSGKKEAFNFLIGQVMKKTRGRADPAELNRMLAGELNKGT